jgi:hypothetical protein
LSDALEAYPNLVATLTAEYTNRRTTLQKAKGDSTIAKSALDKAISTRSATVSARRKTADNAKVAAKAAREAFAEVALIPTLYPSPSVTLMTNGKNALKNITSALEKQKSSASSSWPPLAALYVAIRNTTLQPYILPVPLPNDKDEADLEVKLTLRDDYQKPPGFQMDDITQPFKTTLYFTQRFRITASVGPYFAKLTDYTYVLAAADTVRGLVKLPSGRNAVATDSGFIARQKIVRDNPEQTWSYFGAAVFTHFEYKVTPGLAAALTLGAGGQASGLRGLFGGSIIFGNTQRGVISGGWAVGSVKRLSNVYPENTPINTLSSSVVPTRDVVKWSPFLSLSYNLSSTRK